MVNNKNINIAIKWLAESEIRDNGGICVNYNFKKKKYPWIYSEITGYSINAFLNAFEYTKDERHMQLAVEAADYLAKIQISSEDKKTSGAIPHCMSLPDREMCKEYYAFDAAMCVSGLIDVYKATGNEKYLKAAISAGEWLVNQMQDGDGSFKAMYDGDRQEFAKFAWNDFFGDRGCLHAKNVIALLKLSEITKMNVYKESAMKVCDWVLGLQDSDGAFWANEARSFIFTHAHCYVIEGLLYAFYRLQMNEYKKAAINAADWLIRSQNIDGSFYREYKTKKIMERILPKKTSDATAQAIRIWIILYYLTGAGKYIVSAKKSSEYLLSMQVKESEDNNKLGGFLYQTRSFLWFKHVAPEMMSWPAMFSIQALLMLRDVEKAGDFQKAVADIF